MKSSHSAHERQQLHENKRQQSKVCSKTERTQRQQKQKAPQSGGNNKEQKYIGPGKGAGDTPGTAEEVTEKDKSTVSYLLATGWSCWLGKKAQHCQKRKLLCSCWVGKGEVGSQEVRASPLCTEQSRSCPSPQPQAWVASDESALQCCYWEYICNVEFRWESNKEHKENILVPLINCFLDYI